MQRRFAASARKPADPFGNFLEEVAFQLELQAIATTEDVRGEILSCFVAGLSPVGAVAQLLGIPRDDSPDWS